MIEDDKNFISAEQNSVRSGQNPVPDDKNLCLRMKFSASEQHSAASDKNQQQRNKISSSGVTTASGDKNFSGQFDRFAPFIGENLSAAIWYSGMRTVIVLDSCSDGTKDTGSDDLLSARCS